MLGEVGLLWGAYTRSSTCIREKVGLFFLGGGAYRRRNTVQYARLANCQKNH